MKQHRDVKQTGQKVAARRILNVMEMKNVSFSWLRRHDERKEVKSEVAI